MGDSASESNAGIPGCLQVTGDSAGDVINLVRDSANPSMLDVTVTSGATTDKSSFGLANLQAINVTGGSGNDTLTIDSSNGAINPPGGINYDGGLGSNSLIIKGTAGDVFVANPLGVPGSGIAFVQGNTFGSLVLQSTTYKNVATVTDNIQPLVGDINVLPAIRNGLPDVFAWDSQLGTAGPMDEQVPVLGNVDAALAGVSVNYGVPVSDQGFQLAETAEESPASPGTSILQQLFETGVGAFPLSAIGTSITTVAQLQAALLGLHPTGQVVLNQNGTTTTFTLNITKTLIGQDEIDAEGLFRQPVAGRHGQRQRHRAVGK